MVDRDEIGTKDRREDRAPYERPRLTPLGNLHDLLAGNGSQCDVDGNSGTEVPAGSC